MLLEILIAGHVLIGPKLCQVDLIINKEQHHRFEYVCQENGTLLRESVGMLPFIRS